MKTKEWRMREHSAGIKAAMCKTNRDVGYVRLKNRFAWMYAK